jgi:anaerobic magnesium-protoporphyrin IX monomethyl ester cyclase
LSSVLLVYPYFRPFPDLSVFRFPPLGPAYVAASLRQAGHRVGILDCTFLSRRRALQQALSFGAEVVGIYSMASMLESSLWFARMLRERTRLLVAGGPLPSCEPAAFLGPFDVVVRGEGEQTMKALLQAWQRGGGLQGVPGIAAGRLLGGGAPGEVLSTPPRRLEQDLDSLPFPARELLSNRSYIAHGRRRYGYAVTTVMSTRGCPFRCEFCSNVVFGGSYRERSAGSVVDEIEQALGLGFQRISFADDVFTLNRERTLGICAEIRRRKLAFAWECLGRAEGLDFELAREMKAAGCSRIYFGIESGNDRILELMRKQITCDQARQAVENAHRAGLEVGAFFILFYPGETDDTVLQTLRFAASLPLTYLGLTMPYVLPGTALGERMKGRSARDWNPAERPLLSHVLTLRADVSELKMRFGILRGRLQFEMKKRLGQAAPLASRLFEPATEALLRALR